MFSGGIIFQQCTNLETPQDVRKNSNHIRMRIQLFYLTTYDERHQRDIKEQFLPRRAHLSSVEGSFTAMASPERNQANREYTYEQFYLRFETKSSN